jgi:hypothetical protein
MSIDPKACADFVRSITLQISSDRPESARDASIPDLIKQLGAVNAQAKQKMRTALRELYPDIG